MRANGSEGKVIRTCHLVGWLDTKRGRLPACLATAIYELECLCMRQEMEVGEENDRQSFSGVATLTRAKPELASPRNFG
jgi:hypothetical protein